MVGRATRTWGLLRKTGVRIGTFLGGVATLYHEVYLTDQAEPLLIFLGLWLCGVSPAMFFDGMRKLNQLTDPTGEPPKPQENGAT